MTSKSARSYLGYTSDSENYILKRTTKCTKKTRNHDLDLKSLKSQLLWHEKKDLYYCFHNFRSEDFLITG